MFFQYFYNIFRCACLAVCVTLLPVLSMTEIEPIAGDCDLGDDFYGRRGLEEILNFSSVNPSAPTSVSCSNMIKEMTRDCVSHD